MVSGGRTCCKAERMTPRMSSPEGMMAKRVVTTTSAGKMLSIAE